MGDLSNREKEIFEHALDLASAEERRRYLANECGADTVLLARVEALLRADQVGEEFLPEHPKEMVRIISEKPGDKIGHYKLLQQIGEGGCGAVYMAEQSEPVRRRVALKVIKLGMDTKSVMARFEAERQALALMEHPNIAKVFDAGATETGRPYFVMELVRGVRITDYCDENNLSTKERLKLFMEVCHAIQHAHQKGVIHRDIKPSNILVTVNDAVPLPKIIDFGIAKATNQQPLTDKTLFTAFEQFIGTPAYMSPEQAVMTSLDIDTRTDIYSLGVLLYELLTGKTPFDANELLKAGLDELRRTIRELEPPKPSTRLSTMLEGELTTTAKLRQTEAPKLIHILRGDLDWVVMKCLEKDRTRRYETVNGLAMDIQRYLDNEPVVARPPSRLYRLSKLVRRNKLAFTAGGAVALALIAGIAGSSWEAVRATRAERAARDQAAKAQSVRDFLVDQLLSPFNPYLKPEYYPCKPILVEQMAQAVERAFTNQPLIEAEVRYAIGVAYEGLDECGKVVVQQQKVFDIRKQILGLAHPDTLLAAARLADGYLRTGRSQEAEQLTAQALAAARNSPQTMRSFGAACALKTRARTLNYQGRWAEALPLWREALPLMKQSVGEDHYEIVELVLNASSTLEKVGKVEEGLALLAETEDRWERRHGSTNLQTLFLLKIRGSLLVEHRRATEAAPLLEKALLIQERILSPDQVETLLTPYFLARAYEQQGQFEKASEILTPLSPRFAKHLPDLSASQATYFIAAFFARHRRYAEASATFQTLAEGFQDRPPDLPRQFEMFVAATAATKGWQEAAGTCRRHFDVFADSATAWTVKCSVFAYVRDGESLEKSVARAIALAPRAIDQRDQLAIMRAATLAPLSFASAQADSCAWLIQAIERDVALLPQSEQCSCRRGIGAMQLRLGKFTECVTQLELATQNQRPDADCACALLFKALALSHLGRAAEAELARTQAEAMMKPVLPEPLEEHEAFLTENQRLYLTLRREMETLASNK